MLQGLLDNVISLFEGDSGVRKVADDPVLSAELLLLFRMILADGAVSETEMAVFRRICREAFGIGEESIDGVIEYLNDFGYETNGVAGDRHVPRSRHRAPHAARPPHGRDRQGGCEAGGRRDRACSSASSRCCDLSARICRRIGG